MSTWLLPASIGFHSSDPNKGFRQETGYYTESKEAINQMKANLSNRMNTKI